METVSIPKTKYEKIIKEQRELSRKIRQLSVKLEILGKLEKFEEITSWGRRFAKRKKIKPRDVLIDD